MQYLELPYFLRPPSMGHLLIAQEAITFSPRDFIHSLQNLEKWLQAENLHNNQQIRFDPTVKVILLSLLFSL